MSLILQSVLVMVLPAFVSQCVISATTPRACTPASTSAPPTTAASHRDLVTATLTPAAPHHFDLSPASSMANAMQSLENLVPVSLSVAICHVNESADRVRGNVKRLLTRACA